VDVAGSDSWGVGAGGGVAGVSAEGVAVGVVDSGKTLEISDMVCCVFPKTSFAAAMALL